MKKQSNVKNSRIKIIVFVILLLSFAIVFSIFWLGIKFEGTTFEQYIFQILVPMDGANVDIVFVYFRDLAIFTVIYILAYILAFKNNKKEQPILEIKIHKKIKRINIFPFKHSIKVAVIFLCIALLWFCQGLGLFGYIKAQINVSTIYEDYYVDPRNVKIEFPESKRNLILIHLESMETTYTSKKNGGAFENDLIPELRSIAQNNVNFSNTETLGGAFMTTGTTWTIAGLVAETAGIPLRVPIDWNSYGNYKSFLCNAITLGDILDEQGYNQMMMVGSDMSYGGRDKYFTQHGNYKLFDYYTAIQEKYISKDYYEFWGYEDSKLFEYAKTEILDLAKQDKPFNFSMLTVNTHFTNGYLEKNAKEPFDNQYSNVIADSSKRVSEFVEWIKQQDFYDNTAIVILGDHLTMDNVYIDKYVDETFDRRVYNAYINSSITPVKMKNREFTTMDYFPTILASLNVKIEGNKLGLGTNLFSDEQTLLEKLGKDKLEEQIKKKSILYNEKFLYDIDN